MCISFNQNLSKKEILSNKTVIKELFTPHSSFVFLYPFKFIWIKRKNDLNTAQLPEVLFSVSKRGIRKAAHRNYIKRRMKEAYRLHKSILLQQFDLLNNKYYLGIIYLGKEKLSYIEIKERIVELFQRLPGKP